MRADKIMHPTCRRHAVPSLRRVVSPISEDGASRGNLRQAAAPNDKGPPSGTEQDRSVVSSTNGF
jgi:hypothetical protein